jgi:hypothetical protein
LVFFGTYSYTLFLVHTFIIHLTQKIIKENTASSALILTALTFTLSLVFAYALYQLVEKPYFTGRKTKNSEAQPLPAKKHNFVIFHRKYISITSILLLIVALLLFLAYKPPLAVFTSAERLKLTSKPLEIIGGLPLQKAFTATENNLGMIQFHLRRSAIDGIPATEYVQSQLLVRLQNEQGQELAKSSYEVYQIIDSFYHPFGFPVQIDSKGKKYTIEYQLSKVSPTEELQLINTEGDLITVYFPDKKSLIKQPVAGAKWLIAKIVEPLGNPLFWVNGAYCLPFFGLLLFLKIRKTQNDQKVSSSESL